MSKPKYFNRGVLKGTLHKCELIDYEGKMGKDQFLAVEVKTGGDNRVQGTVFNTSSNPTKAQSLKAQFEEGDKVKVVGTVTEREYDKNGKKGVSRSLSVSYIERLESEESYNSLFVLSGIVNKIREHENGANVVLTIDTSFKNKDNEIVPREEVYNLFADKDALKQMDKKDVTKGCNVQFRGRILNSVKKDEYEMAIGSIQMFLITEVETVIQPEELEHETETKKERLNFLDRN